jgi:hypothetical protein
VNLKLSTGVLAEWSKALASGASGATRAGSNPADITILFTFVLVALGHLCFGLSTALYVVQPGVRLCNIPYGGESGKAIHNCLELPVSLL